MNELDRYQPIHSDVVDLDEPIDPIDDDTPEDEPPGEGEDEQGDTTPRRVHWRASLC